MSDTMTEQGLDALLEAVGMTHHRPFPLRECTVDHDAEHERMSDLSYANEELDERNRDLREQLDEAHDELARLRRQLQDLANGDGA